MKKHVFAATLASLALSLVGCSTDHGTEPQSTQPLRVDVAQHANLAEYYYEQFVGSAGGTLPTAAAQLEIPEDAVTTATRFSIDVTTSSTEVEVDCGPSSIQFAEPVILSIDRPANADPEDELHVEWFDPSTSTWVNIGGTDNGDQVVVELNHFSKYRVNADVL